MKTLPFDTMTTEQYRKLASKEMSEAELASEVLKLAKLFGWKCHHTRPSWSADGERCMTAIQGDKGFVDWVFARLKQVPIEDGGLEASILLVELKTEKGKLSPAQEEWAVYLKPTGLYRLWRPSDLFDGTIEGTLR